MLFAFVFPFLYVPTESRPLSLPAARAAANRSREPGASSSPPPVYTRLSQALLSIPGVAPAANDSSNASANASAATGNRAHRRAPPGTPPAVTDDGYTALTGAVNGRHLEVTDTGDGYTALLEAVDAGLFDAARLLLDRSANPNQAGTDDGVTRAGTGRSGDALLHP